MRLPIAPDVLPLVVVVVGDMRPLERDHTPGLV